MKNCKFLLWAWKRVPKEAELIEFAEKCLSEPHRSRFVRYFVDGEKMSAIAKIDGVSISAVSRSISAALEHAKWLEENTGGW